VDAVAASQGHCLCCCARKTKKRVVHTIASYTALQRSGNVDGALLKQDDLLSMTENRPVSSTGNTGDDMYLNTWVAEVAVAHPNGSLIRRYRQQQSRLTEVRARRSGG
jgi:hypothetical protein